MNEIKNPSQIFPILIFILASIAGAFGQFMYKIGSDRMTLVPVYKNFHLFTGCALFCMVMVLFVIGYRLGGKISIVYPFYGFTFVWGAIIANRFLGESLNMFQWAGIGLVSLGVFCISFAGGA